MLKIFRFFFLEIYSFLFDKVGTKTIKQCIEFHYMPKVNLTGRKIIPTTRTSAVMTRRKRHQMVRAKQLLDDETSSSSSFNEHRLVRNIFYLFLLYQIYSFLG